MMENDKNGVSNQTITFICREFGVNEEWLRTGEGEMYAPLTREEELGKLVRRFFAARPESFQRALITALLRFDPDGPEWVIVERIARSVVEGWQQNQQEAQTDDDGL